MAAQRAAKKAKKEAKATPPARRRTIKTKLDAALAARGLLGKG